MSALTNKLMAMGVNYLIERMKEPGTWLQLTNSLGTVGLCTLKPEFAHQIAMVGVALGGLIGVGTKEGWHITEPSKPAPEPESSKPSEDPPF